MSSSRSSSSSSARSSAAGADQGKLRDSPWDSASLFAKYWLLFMVPIFRRGFKRPLTLEDMGAPPRVDRSRHLGLRLQANYNQQLLSRNKASLIRALFKTFFLELAVFCLPELISKCVAYPMQTIALGWLIRDAGIYLTFANPPPTANATNITPILPADGLSSEQAYWRIIYDAILLVFFSALASTLSHPFFFQTYHIGLKCRVAACYMIYKKALRLSQSAMSETTVGQMVNLLSNDVNRFDQVTQMLPYLVVAPLQTICVAAILSVFYLGLYPTLASLATIAVYVLVQTSMGRGFSKFRAKTAKRTDERVRLMNAIILAMKIIKMYAWERPFKQLVHLARKREITIIGISSILKAINQTLFFISSKVIVFVALMVHMLLGNSFNPEVLFVTIGLANLVRISLTLFFPNAVAYCAETAISCRRIDNFLHLPEMEAQPGHYRWSADSYGCKYSISMHKVHAAWAAKGQQLVNSSEARWAILRSLSLNMRPRELVLVVGRVGSGKSSLLMSILGELPIASGQVEVNGRISYASQEAWIFSGTVRDNILFGKTHQVDRYNEVIRVCSLERDLEILVDGDLTLVGERGVSLSGGQKARVNLARALYNEADIYLLDDPLSAVDAPVAKHIFNESLRTFLSKKTVVLATHQLQFLRHADRVLVIDRHSPAVFGSLQEVMQSEAFAVVGYSREAFEDATTDTGCTDTEQRRPTPTGDDRRGASGSSSPDKDEAPPLVSSRASSNLNESVKSITPLGSKKTLHQTSPQPPAKTKSGSERRKGDEILSALSADWSTYLYYFSNAAGICMGLWFVLTNVLAQGFYLYTDFYLSFWTDSVQRHEYLGPAFVPVSFVDELTLGQISGLYAILIAACFLSTLCRSATFFTGTLRASINIHDKLFKSVIHAPMTFFDFSPIGVLLNRLSRDIGFIDEILPQTAMEIVTIMVNILGILVLTIIINWTNLFMALVLLTLAYFMRNFCARTITRLKQIEGVTRSPIFSHLSTTLSGLATVRAFRAQDEFVRRFDSHQDRHTSAWFTYVCAGRWLTVHMDWLCVTFIFAIVSLLLGFSLDATNASTIGLLISQVVVLPGPFQWGIRQLIELESHMTSVQRVKEFSELQSESELMSCSSSTSTSNESLTEDEPMRLGQVRFINVSLSYFPDEPPVLHQLNLSIRPREKVAVVGRTGAGKSSLVAVLFRLYDFQGVVELDGLDSKLMTLHQLRRSMSIIPQDPVLFGGSLRKNLDPFGEFPDEHLWAALEAVQLKRLFHEDPQGLDMLITESGANFSVGQRQLICLARAIIRRNQVLVLDEATANVDPETDVFIQRTIAQQFAHCTVITIAHRLITIVDADRVLVLERGQMREFDEPYNLIQNESSLFSQMVMSSGQQAPRIKKLIEESHNKRRQRE